MRHTTNIYYSFDDVVAELSKEGITAFAHRTIDDAIWRVKASKWIDGQNYTYMWTVTDVEFRSAASMLELLDEILDKFKEKDNV